MNGVCIRFPAVRAVSSRNKFHTTGVSRKLTPPIPPDITNGSGVDLDEFLGSPGWRLEDLLPPRRSDTKVSADSSITPETLNHLLRLSGLPPPNSPAEERSLLSALHDQLHFVRHVQSVSTEGVEPLIRVGHEPYLGSDKTGVLSFKDCIEDRERMDVQWEPWNVCGLVGGSPGGREQGWFIVSDAFPNQGSDDERADIHSRDP